MTRAVTCPGCNQQIGLADPPEVQENIALQQELKEVKNRQIPSFIPNYQCEDGNCGQIHENSRYAHRPKGKCSNCDQFSSEKEGKCAWCKEKDSIEEIDKDELRDLGIRLPNEY